MNYDNIKNNICFALKCKISDIKNIVPMNKGFTNTSYTFFVNGKKYVYRSPGVNTKEYINRKSEVAAQITAKALNVDSSFVYEDEKLGWKISEFINITDTFSYENEQHLKSLCNLLKTLHSGNRRCNKEFDFFKELSFFTENIKLKDTDTYNEVYKYYSTVAEIDLANKSDNWQKELCHNDIYADNLLISDGKLFLIDWEYAGDSDMGCDLCSLIVESRAFGDKIDEVLSVYYGRKPTTAEKKHIVGCAVVVFYYWYLWAVYLYLNGEGNFALMFKHCHTFSLYLNEYYKI